MVKYKFENGIVSTNRETLPARPARKHPRREVVCQNSTSEQFIEDSGVAPADAVQVGWTWRFVNVKGGPDRRYANNRQLPVMQYGSLYLTSPQGLYWRLQVSRADAAPAVASALSGAPALPSA